MKHLIRILAALFRRPQPIKVVPANSPDLTLQVWRENQELTKALAKLMREPVMQAAIQTLRNESPLNYIEMVMTPDAKIHRLGRIEGYQLFLNNLEALAILAKKQEPLEATFEPPEKEEPEKEK